ncbi:hypothetical protein H257_15415 [Aphanomyces astaci]|uniref:Uncharacterized protein n=1 Tax=Aphanomyces astaci TaxID=112090 RepID=W4FM69_APHAT|nr:hypothetical protein H257_15415 [Aphanomyces astaci]ETV68602.1 hypothetical protein H257_15415 [Aphanomyces astaci]|eukprot:XP_009841827.1 hypothetical protein H257_15415 [Aphanomyces astaci]
MVPRLVRTVYGWLNWICLSLLPFAFVSNPLVRHYTNLDTISRTSFMNLGETADIVQCPAFESGVVKILSGRADTLTEVDVSAVERLAVPVANQTAATEMAQPPMSSVQHALKKQRVTHGGYIDCLASNLQYVRAILLGDQAGDWRSSLLHYITPKNFEEQFASLGNGRRP